MNIFPTGSYPFHPPESPDHLYHWKAPIGSPRAPRHRKVSETESLDGCARPNYLTNIKSAIKDDDLLLPFFIKSIYEQETSNDSSNNRTF